jgi:hypothetical protein
LGNLTKGIWAKIITYSGWPYRLDVVAVRHRREHGGVQHVAHPPAGPHHYEQTVTRGRRQWCTSAPCRGTVRTLAPPPVAGKMEVKSELALSSKPWTKCVLSDMETLKFKQ